ncbi:bacterial transcriptional activator domain-containing protein [Lachnospiraceae bacterium 62-35]
MKEKSPGLFVHMLGTPFYVCTDDKKEIYEIFTSPMLRNRSIKMLHLLAYLLYHHGKMTDRSRLLSMLYGEDYDETACNNLRAVVFRLRKILRQMDLPEGNYILNQKGTYSWNEELYPLEIDAEQFEKEAVQALSLKDDRTEEKIKALKEAISGYGGSFLTLFENETWVIQEELKYRRLLEDCMDTLYYLLESQERQKEIISLCSRLLSLAPDEKWYIFQVRAFLALNQPALAYRIYEEAVNVMVDRMGRQPSAEFRDVFKVMNKKAEKSLESVKDIREMLSDKTEQSQAYYCSFPSFIDAYRISNRLMKRSKSPSFLILCTITNQKGNIIENKKKLEKVSEQLREAIMKSARGSDIMTCYNLSQYLLLLNGITREECPVVTGRINQKFKQTNTSPNYMINYYISSVMDVPPLSAITEYR